jgi:hypothetical protein
MPANVGRRLVQVGLQKLIITIIERDAAALQPSRTDDVKPAAPRTQAVRRLVRTRTGRARRAMQAARTCIRIRQSGVKCTASEHGHFRHEIIESRVRQELTEVLKTADPAQDTSQEYRRKSQGNLLNAIACFPNSVNIKGVHALDKHTDTSGKKWGGQIPARAGGGGIGDTRTVKGNMRLRTRRTFNPKSN